jgi:predicted ATPase
MTSNILVTELRLKNFLSFGDQEQVIPLSPLNVLIGPNASGKSNLIEAFRLLRTTPKNLGVAIREGGGIKEWLWKGEKTSIAASIEAVINYPKSHIPLRYRLAFTATGQRFEIVDEAIENARPTTEQDAEPYFYYRYQNGHPVLNVVNTASETQPKISQSRTEHRLRREDVHPEKSILSQRKDIDIYPEITFLGNQFENMRMFMGWDTGKESQMRLPQTTDAPNDFLLENASNLGLILNDLFARSKTRQLILDKLQDFYDTLEDITTKVQGGTIQVFAQEKGLQEAIPATRLSDGTLQYLCLLSILCHPSPPPLICIEEPEIGLHPDILTGLAELLVDASQRTQLIITTHSDILVSALTDTPETVLVCDKQENGTFLKRLDKDTLEKWLEHYSLGDLWLMGEIGGT